MSYLNFEKNKRVQTRNEILLNQLRNKFIEEDGFSLIFLQKSGFSHTKPQDLVKLCDNILLLIKQNKETTILNDGRAPVQDAFESYYSVYRCFFVACYHIASNNHLFAISLLAKLQGQFVNVTDEISSCSGLPEAE